MISCDHTVIQKSVHNMERTVWNDFSKIKLPVKEKKYMLSCALV